jgi:bifunctional DNA-binding transcriptional regulator/antitoxin component of YhaV-PrlF toxin-antitoxin module
MAGTRRSARIGEGGTLTLPAALLRRHHLKDGDFVSVEDDERAVLIVPEDKHPEATPEVVPQPLTIPEPTPAQLARRRALVDRILANRQQRVISPLTTADLVHLAREDDTWYGDDR